MEVDIPDFPDYTINTEGQIFSKKSNRLLRPGINSSGYYCVSITRDNKIHALNVHRALAEIFIPNPNNYRWVSF